MRASASAIAIVIAIEKTGNQRLKCEIKCKRLSVEIKCFPKAGGMRASASAIAIVIAIEKTGNQRLKCEIKCKRRSVRLSVPFGVGIGLGIEKTFNTQYPTLKSNVQGMAVTSHFPLEAFTIMIMTSYRQGVSE